MNPLTQRAIKYLNAIGLDAKNPRAWVKTKSLPYYLRDAFALELIDVLGKTLLLAIDEDKRHTPAQLESLTSRLAEASAGSGADTVVYTTAGMSSTERKRLIDRGISFLVPSHQLFLPAQGMVDLRETFQTPPPEPVQHLSPATQAMFLCALQHNSAGEHSSEWASSMGPDWTREWVPSEVARYLGYAPMTSSRAVRELVAAGLVEQFKPARGHQRVSMVADRRESWEQAQPVLRSPVQRTVWMRDLAEFGQAREAGESALAYLSMLAAPRRQTIAVDRNAWAAANPQDFELTPDGRGGYEVQVWSYTTRINPHAETVDPLSLYLSMRDNPDERVEAALEEMMEALPW